MRYCLLCNKVNEPGSGVFFSVPKDEHKRQKWMEICRMDISPKSHICIDHFASKDIIASGRRFCLMPNAMPIVQQQQELTMPSYNMPVDDVEFPCPMDYQCQPLGRPLEELRFILMEEVTPTAALKSSEQRFKEQDLQTDTQEVECALCEKRCQPDSRNFFKVPQDESKRNVWSKACCMNFSPGSMICEDHFPEKCKITYKNRVTLLPNAVPLRPRLTKKQLEAKIGSKEKVIDDDNRSEISVNMPISSSYLNLPDPLNINRVSFDVDEMVEKQFVNKEIQTDPNMFGYENYVVKCRQLENEIKDLKLQIMRTSLAMNSMYKIFTEGQIRKLTSPADIHWRDHDMENAMELYRKGSGAYKYLYKKGFPLPHISSLQRWERKRKKNKNQSNNSTSVLTNESIDGNAQEEEVELEELEAVQEDNEEVNDFSGDDNDWFDDFYEEETTDNTNVENNITTTNTESVLIETLPTRHQATKDANQDVRNKIRQEVRVPLNVTSPYASPDLNSIITSSNTKFFIAQKPMELEKSQEKNYVTNVKGPSKSSTVNVIATPSVVSQCDMPDINSTTPVNKIGETMDRPATEERAIIQQNVLITKGSEIEPIDYNEFLESINADYIMDGETM